MLFIASALLVTARPAQSAGGVYALGISADAKVRFTWQPNAEPDLAGYKLYAGTISGVYVGSVDVGRTTTFELFGLVRGTTYYFALTAYNTAGLESDFTSELSYHVPMLVETVLPASAPEVAALENPDVSFNSPPVISTIPNHALSKNRASEPLPFLVNDLETSPDRLEITAHSSNPAVVPSFGLIIKGSHANRTLVIDPSNGRTGVCTVTIEVSDGSATTTTTFLVTVGD